MMKYFLSLSLIFLFTKGLCQVNGYAKVTSISGTTLNLSNVNETFDTFEPGQEAVIMQMQDDVIGSNTLDNSSFGDLSAIGSAGLYEIVTIVSVTPAIGTPTSVTISSATNNTYNTGSNSSLQLITYPTFDDGGGNFTTTGNITAVAWDGNVGGVIAFKVNGTLTLLHSINADGAGFRGGAKSVDEGTVDCYANWITNASTQSGEKGEGIYKRTDANYRYGRAKILNGGGGGNRHNAGGGGGGNVTSGGDGGPGYNCSATPVGGNGGISLSAQISASRIFMGGGGGGGHQNNSVGSSGGDGGGIILIRATEIITTASCGGVTVSANGVDAAGANDDGAGGGGAGGSIIFDVDNFNISGSCPLVVAGDGGAGGSVSVATVHGGGGGGGQGRVLYSGIEPTNTTTSTNNGNAGCNDSSSPCTNSAGSPTGTSGDGITDAIGNTPLPVSFLYFKGQYEAATKSVLLKWATASERDNDYFVVQVSWDGMNFDDVGTIYGYGTTNEMQIYQFQHHYNFSGYMYYRLKQVDRNGDYDFSKIIFVEHSFSLETLQVNVYPNPTENNIVRFRLLTDSNEEASATLTNLQGRQVALVTIESEHMQNEIQINSYGLQPGIYMLSISQGEQLISKKIIVK